MQSHFEVWLLRLLLSTNVFDHLTYVCQQITLNILLCKRPPDYFAPSKEINSAKVLP